MASIGDYILLIIVISIIGGIVYATKGGDISKTVKDQKENMKVSTSPRKREEEAGLREGLDGSGGHRIS